MKRLLRCAAIRIRLAGRLLAFTLAAGLLPLGEVFWTEGRALIEGEAQGIPGRSAVSGLEAWCYDLPLRWRWQSPPADWVVVEITTNQFERVFEAGGRKVSRRHLGTALERLSTLRPRLLVLDLVLAQGSDGSPDDLRIAEWLRRFGTNVVLGTSVEQPSDRPAPMFATSGVTLASIDVTRNPGNTVRLLPERFALAETGRTMAVVAAERLGPVTSAGPRPKARWLNYYRLRSTHEPGSHCRSFPSLDFAELVLSDESRLTALASQHAAKVVFVGDGHGDRFRNPVDGGDIPGVEVHATAAANLLNDAWLRPVRMEFQMLFFVAWALALALGLDAVRTSGARVAVAAGTALLLAASFALPLLAGYWWLWLVAVGQSAVALLATLCLPQPIHFFVSYRDAGGGREVAQWLEGAIRGAGWRAFLSPGQTPAGADLGRYLERRIRRAPVFLLVLTELARKDLSEPVERGKPACWPWVRREVARALEKRRRLLVLRVGTDPIKAGQVPEDLAALADHLDREFTIESRDAAVRDALRVLYGGVE